MRIECTHCHHRGYTAWQKLKASPLQPVICHYCRRRSYPRPLVSAGVWLLAGALPVAGWLAFSGRLGVWSVVLAAALLGLALRTLLVQPALIVSDTRIRRDRLRITLCAGLLLLAVLGLQMALSLGSSAPAVSG